MSDCIDIKSIEEFKKGVLESTVPVIVDFWAPWCGPCRMVSPVLEELQNDLDGKFVIAKVNVDEAPEIATKYSIVSIPTMFLFKNGEQMDKIIGALPKAQLKAFVEKNI